MRNPIKTGGLVAVVTLTAFGISGCVILPIRTSRAEVQKNHEVVRLSNGELLSQLEDSDWRVAIQAMLELEGMGQASIPIWKKALESRNWQVRYWAVEKLGNYLDRSTIDTLFTFLKDENNYVRRKTVEALIKVGGKYSLVNIRPMAKDLDPYVRRVVIHNLCRFGDKNSLALFMEGLKDKDPIVRYESAVALGSLTDPSSRDVLEQAKADEHDWVRYAVEDALKKLEALNKSNQNH